ncbi:procyclic acidic repetitive family protein [Candidatus Woesearchaeota archaeon]|nr:procyclic acidic repetitive family protein [Candidatus Woesearchaeota archaeon]
MYKKIGRGVTAAATALAITTSPLVHKINECYAEPLLRVEENKYERFILPMGEDTLEIVASYDAVGDLRNLNARCSNMVERHDDILFELKRTSFVNAPLLRKYVPEIVRYMRQRYNLKESVAKVHVENTGIFKAMKESKTQEDMPYKEPEPKRAYVPASKPEPEGIMDGLLSKKEEQESTDDLDFGAVYREAEEDYETLEPDETYTEPEPEIYTEPEPIPEPASVMDRWLGEKAKPKPKEKKKKPSVMDRWLK